MEENQPDELFKNQTYSGKDKFSFEKTWKKIKTEHQMLWRAKWKDDANFQTLFSMCRRTFSCLFRLQLLSGTACSVEIVQPKSFLLHIDALMFFFHCIHSFCCSSYPSTPSALTPLVFYFFPLLSSSSHIM